ncbi:MAG: heme ABC transporter ATP-binding protein [Cyclobacteriaceae bacterium]|nr:heme ABC transporter ATP-binding protein [Cyclobacteriaceae bacterium]
MIRADHITVSAGSKKLLDDVAVDFQPGKINLIIGPNGAGKSTLIKVLAKQLRPHSGKVFYGNRDIQDVSIPQLAKVRAVLSQNVELAFPLTVKEVVMMGRYPHMDMRPSKIDHDAVREAMQFFDVTEMTDRNYMSLSGGEKQRVHFARVVSQILAANPDEPRYLLLDEPLTFLDVFYQFQFMRKMQELLSGNNLVLVGVVHDLNLAARFASQVALLHQGKLVNCGSPEEVLTKENIKNVYQVEPIVLHMSNVLHVSF